MTDENTPPTRQTSLGRRGLLGTTAGVVALVVGSTAVAGQVHEQPTVHRFDGEQSDPSSPEDVAQAYVAALDAGNRAAANDLIADDGELDPWGRRAFGWIDAFEIEYVGFRTLEADGRDVVGEIRLTVAGTDGSARYRFRETDDGDWTIWESIDGLRTNDGTGPAETAAAYVAALDADNRAAANDLIADDGELAPWSRREFEWVGAFDIGLVGVDTVDRRDGSVTADLDVTIAGTTEQLRYEFRRVERGEWKLWRSLTGLR
jgi:hypothetical protein